MSVNRYANGGISARNGGDNPVSNYLFNLIFGGDYIPRPYEIKENEIHNRLKIIREVEPHYTSGGNKKRMVEVLCECGVVKNVRLEEVLSGGTKSCGCYNLEKAGKSLITHNLSGTRLHRIWKDMRRRCNNPNRNNYKNYGGRGIKVCEEWNDYATFHEWAINNGYSDELSIERIDNDGNYEPINCKWITMDEQKLNTRQNRKFKATSPEGIVYYDTVIKRFANEHDLKNYCISDCLNGRQHTHKGWKFELL